MKNSRLKRDWIARRERLRIRIKQEMQREDISVDLRAGLGRELILVEEELKFLTPDDEEDEGGIETRYTT